MKSCFNPFVYPFITCNGSHTTWASANLRWISLPHYGIFKIALIGLIELLKLQPFSIVSVWQTTAAKCCACEFPLHLHSSDIFTVLKINGKQLLYPAESQVITSITNQRVNFTLGNHNMYILFFSAGNRGNKENYSSNWDRWKFVFKNTKRKRLFCHSLSIGLGLPPMVN